MERVIGMRFRFNLHLFHVGMGRPTACRKGQTKSNESEIKINSIFDLKLWIVPDPMEFHNFFLKRIESNLSFSSTKKGDTEKKTSNNLDLKSKLYGLGYICMSKIWQY